MFTKMRMDVPECAFEDHSYSRKGSETDSFVRPTRRLFFPKTHPVSHGQEVIDVVNVTKNPPPSYDVNKSMEVMDECEKFVGFARIEGEKSEDWEDTVDKSNWTNEQSSLFRKVIRILNTDRLARLAVRGRWSEPALRRAHVDRSASQFRDLMSQQCRWDSKLCHWLHGVLLEYLDTSYLAAYLDILQTLKRRIPTLVDRLLAGAIQKNSPVLEEGLSLLLKRPWDPAASSIHGNKLGKLPGNPILILIPSRIKKYHKMSPRSNLWSSHLSHLATLITVHSSLAGDPKTLTLTAFLDQYLSLIRQKVSEARSEHPNRPIILIGWRSGASLAVQIATSMATSAPNSPITACVCLGLATRTADGQRGGGDDILYQVSCPVLFVTGENALCARPEDFEDVRVKMRSQTGLVVVGGTDDYLRMRRRNRIKMGVTQSMVDRAVLEEVGEFLANILLQPQIPLRKPQMMYNSSANLYMGNILTTRPYKRRLSNAAGGDVNGAQTKRPRTEGDEAPKRGRRPIVRMPNNNSSKPSNENDSGQNNTNQEEKKEPIQIPALTTHQTFRIQGGRIATPLPNEPKIESSVVAIAPKEVIPVVISNETLPPVHMKSSKSSITVARPITHMMMQKLSTSPQIKPVMLTPSGQRQPMLKPASALNFARMRTPKTTLPVQPRINTPVRFSFPPSTVAADIKTNNFIVVSTPSNLASKMINNQASPKVIPNQTMIRTNSPSRIAVTKGALPLSNPLIVSASLADESKVFIKNKIKDDSDSKQYVFFKGSTRLPNEPESPSDSTLKGRPLYIIKNRTQDLVEKPVVIPAIESKTRSFSEGLKDVSYGDDGDTLMLPLGEDIDVESVIQPAKIPANLSLASKPKAKQLLLTSESGTEYIVQKDGKYVIKKRKSSGVEPLFSIAGCSRELDYSQRK